MNAVLRQVSRQLKYRELPALIGRRVVVTSAASACAEVHAQLHGSLPYGARFKGPESQYITRALAKYGILDLEFTGSRDSLGAGRQPRITSLGRVRIRGSRATTGGTARPAG